MAVKTVPDPSVQQTTTETEDLIVAIVEAVAADKGVDPMELDLQLAEQIDLDALATVYTSASQHPETTVTVKFTVDDCTVTVRNDGEITVS